MVTPTSSSSRRSYQPRTFGPASADRRVTDDLGQQVLEGARVGLGVVVQQPDPLLISRPVCAAGHPWPVGLAGAAGCADHMSQAEQHGSAETAARISLDDAVGTEGVRDQRARLVGAAGVDGDHGVRLAGLRSERGEGAGQPGGPVCATRERS